MPIKKPNNKTSRDKIIASANILFQNLDNHIRCFVVTWDRNIF